MMKTFSDGTISVMTDRFDYKNRQGKVYNIYYAGFNVTENLASDDAAYIKISVDGEIYDNLENISTWPYSRFSYVLINDKSYRKWVTNGGKDQGWTHLRVEITNVEKNSDQLVFTVYDDQQEFQYTFKKK